MMSRTWFDELSLNVQERLRQAGSPQRIDPGETLIAEGDLDNHLFFLEEGTCEVKGVGAAPIAVGPGTLLGEMAFLDNSPRTRTVIATSPLAVRRLDRMELMRAYADEPEALRELLEAIAALRDERRAKLAAIDEAALSEGPTGYVRRLAEESLRHRAVHHPYLRALAEGNLPDLHWALADFARQYIGYSAHFPRYLTTVISRLEQPAHRAALLENLTEESGTYADEELAELSACGIEREWIEGIPHPQLFQRFSRALGVVTVAGEECDQVAIWRELFLGVLANGPPAEALGALGLGTENIVRTMYGSFVQALERVGELSARDTVFFPLHTAVDDHHQAALQAISANFAATPEDRVGLRRGMLKALQLRCTFWDWMLARAQAPADAARVL